MIERKTVPIEEIRNALADYMLSEGCCCCRSDDHDENAARLGKLLQVPPYEDGSGYDFYQFGTERDD